MNLAWKCVWVQCCINWFRINSRRWIAPIRCTAVRQWMTHRSFVNTRFTRGDTSYVLLVFAMQTSHCFDFTSLISKFNTLSEVPISFHTKRFVFVLFAIILSYFLSHLLAKWFSKAWLGKARHSRPFLTIFATVKTMNIAPNYSACDCVRDCVQVLTSFLHIYFIILKDFIRLKENKEIMFECKTKVLCMFELSKVHQMNIP